MSREIQIKTLEAKEVVIMKRSNYGPRFGALALCAFLCGVGASWADGIDEAFVEGYSLYLPRNASDIHKTNFDGDHSNAFQVSFYMKEKYPAEDIQDYIEAKLRGNGYQFKRVVDCVPSIVKWQVSSLHDSKGYRYAKTGSWVHSSGNRHIIVGYYYLSESDLPYTVQKEKPPENDVCHVLITFAPWGDGNGPDPKLQGCGQ